MRKAVRECLQQAPHRYSHSPTHKALPQLSVNGSANTHNTNDLPYEVDVTFVTDAEMAALNRNYRHKNRPTDVLSFAQMEGPDFIGDGGHTDSRLLGDIIISLETAQRQASQLRHDLATEVAFLGVHGALHLLGYDHMTASDRRVMWKWQEAIFEEIKPRVASLG
ncbi:MAG: rRNA maturation RNase YbeY [Abitibacteriaceae bacterium]|nr:rRNA maturation RNase YbeY [Abditibacteriaceae bacterium]